MCRNFGIRIPASKNIGDHPRIHAAASSYGELRTQANDCRSCLVWLLSPFFVSLEAEMPSNEMDFNLLWPIPLRDLAWRSKETQHRFRPRAALGCMHPRTGHQGICGTQCTGLWCTTVHQLTIDRCLWQHRNCLTALVKPGEQTRCD